jgi:hypothetical protein
MTKQRKQYSTRTFTIPETRPGKENGALIAAMGTIDDIGYPQNDGSPEAFFDIIAAGWTVLETWPGRNCNERVFLFERLAPTPNPFPRSWEPISKGAALPNKSSS